MIAIRLASSSWPVDSGEGASRFGGRWNLPGTPVIYCASTRSLACIEIIAHHRAVPADYQVIVIQIPDDLVIENFQAAELLDEDQSARFGTAWASSLRTAVLRVPSAIWPTEHNFLLNPLHPEFRLIKFSVADERIDERLREQAI